MFWFCITERRLHKCEVTFMKSYGTNNERLKQLKVRIWGEGGGGGGGHTCNSFRSKYTKGSKEGSFQLFSEQNYHVHLWLPSDDQGLVWLVTTKSAPLCFHYVSFSKINKSCRHTCKLDTRYIGQKINNTHINITVASWVTGIVSWNWSSHPTVTYHIIT